MKYKVGDKFLMEIEISGINEIDTSFPYRASTHGPDWTEEALDKLRRPDDMTAEEAWEMVREICDMDCEKTCEIFGTNSIVGILKNNPDPQQTKAKIEAWEAARKIGIGDEVEFADTANGFQRAMYVTSKFGDNNYCGICKNGDTYCVDVSALKKTGRHIDIQRLLDQIGGVK